jgi:hypothetical protein
LSCGTGHEPSLVCHFLLARRETFSCKLPSPQGGEAFTSFSLQREKATPDARQHLARGTACRGSYRRHHPWTPSREWLRANRCCHGRASEDVSRGSLTTSSRSSIVGATLAFAMQLAPCLSVVLCWLSPTSREKEVPWPGLFLARTVAAFVFFLQVGLRMALHHMEVVANRPAVPWPGRRSADPYLFSSWSGPSDRCWDPPVPEHRHRLKNTSCETDAQTNFQGITEYVATFQCFMHPLRRACVAHSVSVACLSFPLLELVDD